MAFPWGDVLWCGVLGQCFMGLHWLVGLCLEMSVGSSEVG